MNETAAHLIWPVLAPDETIATSQRNIVGDSMLRAFDHSVTTCCDMLAVENGQIFHAVFVDVV